MIPFFKEAIYRPVNKRGKRYNVSVNLYTDERFYWCICRRSWTVIIHGVANSLEEVQKEYDTFIGATVKP